MAEAVPESILRSQQDLDRALADAGPVLLFKHSTACPVSAAAYREFRAWLGDRERPRAALIHVIEDRPVSNAIAERLGVRHESPQAILVQDGAAAWSASHGAITAAALRKATGSAAR